MPTNACLKAAMAAVVAAMFLCLLAGLNSHALGAEFGDIELGFYGLGSWPVDKPIFNQGVVEDASLKNGFGGGVKVSLFPHFTRRIVGIEIDSSGHGGALSFSGRDAGMQSGSSRSDLLVFNTMINVLVKYPGERIQPYVGIGGGWTHGILLNPNIAGRSDQDFEAARALAYQFLAGTRISVSSRVFLFGEYRYFSANYHWEGLALDFRAQYGVVGFGLRF
jgi:opacity protein-like surface antigen